MNNIIVLFYCIISSFKLISIKELNKRKFNHQFFQVFFSYFSSLILLFIYYYKNRNLSIHNILLTIPSSLLDVSSTCIFFHIFSKINVSTYQLLKTSVIPFSILLSIIIFNKFPTKYEIIGALCIISGILISSLHFDNNKNNNNTSIENIGLILLSEFFISCQMIYEEYIMKTYNLKTQFVIGFESFFGIIFTFGIVILQHNFDFINSTKTIFEELNNDNILYLILLFIYCVIPLDAIISIKIIKRISAQYRSLLNSLRMIFVTFLSVIFKFEEKPTIITYLGFLFIIMGIILSSYNPLKKEEEPIIINENENDISNNEQIEYYTVNSVSNNVLTERFIP